jgi:hypothetical protein
MPNITDNLITEHAERYGLKFRSLGDMGWVTRIQVGDGWKDISISNSPNAIFFSVYPLIKDVPSKRRSQLAENLLLKNSQSAIVKYSVDAEDWAILLTVEYPPVELSYQLFAAALDALREELAKSYSELLKLA